MKEHRIVGTTAQTAAFMTSAAVALASFSPVLSADDSVFVDVQGFLGVGTNTPEKQFHVVGEDVAPSGQNSVMLRVENVSSTSASRRMLELVNHGSPLLAYRDTARGDTWTMNPVGDQFRINKGGTGQFEFSLSSSGDVAIAGTLTEGSSRSVKADIEPVEPAIVLSHLAELLISEWRYANSEARHIGPMAEDFHAAYGLGESEAHISPRDMAGVAMASVQALHALVVQQQVQIQELQQQVAEVETLREQVAEMRTRMPEQVADNVH